MPQTDTPTLGLPTEDDYSAIERKLRIAHDALEQLNWRLEETLATRHQEAGWQGREPTLTDVGALWTFQDYVRLTTNELNKMRRQLEDLLSELDSARLDIPLSRAA